MYFKPRPPHDVILAWRNLTYKKERLALSILGISFAVVIMFTQIGIYNASVDSSVNFINKLNADLLLTNKLKTYMAYIEPFSLRRLQQVAALPDIKAAYPLYIETEKSLWKNPHNAKLNSIRVLAFDLRSPVLQIPEIQTYITKLQLPETVLIDQRSSHSFYGEFGPGMVTRLADHRVTIVGEFTLGQDFAYSGNIIMSTENFIRYFPSKTLTSRLDQVEVGLLKVCRPAELAKTRANLQKCLPEDVVVYTKDEFIAMETEYWIEDTALGTIFFVGVLVGFGIGVLICYQILYADVMRHLKQFATIKAMGFSNRFLTLVILQQGVFLAILGFGCGFIISYFAYDLLSELIDGIIMMKLEIVVLIFILTVLMCIVAGILSARRALHADPAELF